MTRQTTRMMVGIGAVAALIIIMLLIPLMKGPGASGQKHPDDTNPPAGASERTGDPSHPASGDGR